MNGRAAGKRKSVTKMQSARMRARGARKREILLQRVQAAGIPCKAGKESGAVVEYKIAMSRHSWNFYLGVGW